MAFDTDQVATCRLACQQFKLIKAYIWSDFIYIIKRTPENCARNTLVPVRTATTRCPPPHSIACHSVTGFTRCISPRPTNVEFGNVQMLRHPLQTASCSFRRPARRDRIRKNIIVLHNMLSCKLRVVLVSFQPSIVSLPISFNFVVTVKPARERERGVISSVMCTNNTKERQHGSYSSK